jgi:hypothetical protein
MLVQLRFHRPVTSPSIGPPAAGTDRTARRQNVQGKSSPSRELDRARGYDADLPPVLVVEDVT